MTEAKIPSENINEAIGYLENAIEMLFEYGRIKRHDVVCEVLTIKTIIIQLQGGG